MTRIGIIGGIGPETTVEYYRRILDLYRRRNPDRSAPYIIINSLDMKKPAGHAHSQQTGRARTFLSEEVGKHWRAPARLLPSVAANTPHLVFDAIARAIPYSAHQHR
jgi:aspartate racemase